MRTEDGEIIQECLNGKPQAFGILVDKYREGVYAFSYAELRDFQDAQDVTQEVFLQAYRKLRSLRNRESFAFWLYRIAYRYCVQCLRDRARRVDRDFIEDQDPRVVDAPSLDSHRESQLDESVREALDMLPDAYREVLLLHYFGGLTIKDIAKAIGASPAAIGMRLSRARAQLKEEMIAMMDTAFEGHRLSVGFTFRIVEVVKRIKINPMPRTAGLPWGLSLAVGIIVTVLSLNPHMSIPSDVAIPTGSPLPMETKVLRTGEIPVYILKTSEISVIASKQGNGNGGKPHLQEPQNAFMLAPQQDGGGTWTQKADMQGRRDLFSTCVVDGEIYAICGNDDDIEPPLSTVEKYNPGTNTWTRITDMPTPRFLHSSSVIDGKIYIIGGATKMGRSARIHPILVYDPAKDEWMEKADTPYGVAGHCSAVVNGKLYMIGGCERGNDVSTVFEYDPGADTWTPKADMPTARHSAAVVVVNGKIYVIGGGVPRFAEWRPLSAVEEYDPVADRWTERADIPTARCNLSASVLDGKIYAIGGSLGTNGPTVSTVEQYDPETNTWKGVADMPTSRCASCSNAMDGRIYAIGGRTVGVGTTLSTVEEYTPEGWQISEQSSISPQGKLPTKWGEVKSD